jgi:catechol 2,3-dioxygenase-like lactoylglutathione lyase family enzyme
MKAKISIITLGVHDLERSLTFYRDGLGFPATNYKEGDDSIFFPMEGTWLALYPRGKLAEDANVTSTGVGFEGVTLAHNAPSKAKVDEVFRQAIAAGGSAVKEPQEVVWGGYSGYFADPDGHLWEVAFNPFTDLT